MSVTLFAHRVSSQHAQGPSGHQVLDVLYDCKQCRPHLIRGLREPVRSLQPDGSYHLTKTHAKLLRHTRPITYASCQAFTLRGRVHLCDTSSPHFSKTRSPSPKGMGRLRSLATLTPTRSPLAQGNGAAPKPRHSHPSGGGLWRTDCPFLLPEPGKLPGWAKARNSAHGDQLRARGSRRADVEVLHRKMRVVGVAEPDPPAQREPQQAGVGDRVAAACSGAAPLPRSSGRRPTKNRFPTSQTSTKLPFATSVPAPAQRRLAPLAFR